MYDIFGKFGAIRQIRLCAAVAALRPAGVCPVYVRCCSACYSLFLTQQCAGRGCAKETRGTAFVIYEDIYDAKNAVDHLSGFNVANRYLIVLYYQTNKQHKKGDAVRGTAAEAPCTGSAGAPRRAP